MARAMDFVLRSRAGAIRAGVISGGEQDAVIDLTGGGDVSLNIKQSDIQSYSRNGRDLQVILADGRTVTIKGYFEASGPANRLFVSTNGEIAQVGLSEGEGGHLVPRYGRAESWGKWSPNDALTFYNDGAVADDVTGMGPFIPGMIGGISGNGALAAALLGGAVLIGSSSDSDGAPTEPTLPTIPTEPTLPTELTNPSEPTDPTEPTEPTVPTDPTEPTEPTQPTDPTIPTEPTEPSVPTEPTIPTDPTEPTEPTAPTEPTDPTIPTEPTEPSVPTEPTIPTDPTEPTEPTHPTLPTEPTPPTEPTYPTEPTEPECPTEPTTPTQPTEPECPTEPTTPTLPTHPTEPTEPECPTEPTTPTEPECPTQPTCPPEPTCPVDVAPSVDNASATLLLTGNDAPARIGITGWAPAGSTVVVVLGGMTVQARAANNGRWETSFEGDRIPADGTWRATATVTERDGTRTVLAGPRAIVDMTPPDLDVTSGAESNGHVVDTADRADGVEIGGSSEPGARITVTLDGVAGGSLTTWAGADGSWEVTFPAGLFPHGDYTQGFAVTATDAFGNNTVTRDRVEVDARGCGCARLAIDNVTADNVVNAAEDKAGVTLSGTATAGATVALVLKLANGETLDASTTANSSGVWTARLDRDLLPQGEYGAVLVATSTAPNGTLTRTTHEFTVDTLVNRNAIDADKMAGDGIVNAVEAAGGFVLTGQAEAGAQSVTVHFEGVRRAATVNADGTWQVAFRGGEIAGGEFTSAVSVTVLDAAGNTRTDAALVQVDTLPPEAASVTSVTHAGDSVLAVGAAGESHLDFSLVGGSPLETSTWASPSGQMYFFDEALPDGSTLVVTNSDAAGNRTDALVVLGDAGPVSLDLARMDLDGYQIAEIDLNYAPEANLIITEAQLRELSGGTDALVVHGDAQDSVTAPGASNTGERVEIEGQSYHVYTLGDAGASLIISEDVTVHTSVV